MVVPRTRPEFPSQPLGWFIAGCIVLFVGQMTAVILLAEVGEEHEAVAQTEPSETETETTETEPTETEPTETEPTETEPPRRRRRRREARAIPSRARRSSWETGDCGSCHTLADAGTNGTIGPNLDESQPPVELVVDRVTNGRARCRRSRTAERAADPGCRGVRLDRRASDFPRRLTSCAAARRRTGRNARPSAAIDGGRLLRQRRRRGRRRA